MVFNAGPMDGIIWGMAGGLLGSYDGLTGKKQVIMSGIGVDTVAGMMPIAMMYTVE